MHAPRINIFTAADGYRIATRVWEHPDPVGQVVFLHGIVSHSGWYTMTCRKLWEAGFSVHAPDRRGSGLNLAHRGDVDHWRTWLEDVRRYVQELPPKLPTLLVGVSWGGKLAVALARERLAVRAIGLVCPGLFARQLPGPVRRMIVRAACGVGLAGCRVQIPLQDPALFTDSPDWRQYIASDPLTLREITLRFAREDGRLTRFATSDPREINTSVLLMLAGHDRMVHNHRTRSFVESFTTPERQILEYPEAAHTLEFEPDPRRYVQDLCEWATKQVGSGINLQVR